MTRGSPLIKRLKKLASLIPDDNAVRETLQALEPEDAPVADHAIAMIGAATLERALEIAISSRFIPLTSNERKRLFGYQTRGPLSDFSARIQFAYALNLVDSGTRDELEYIRAIRNIFAHAEQLITFETEEVRDICADLKTPETVTILGSVAGPTPRGRYIETTVALTRRLKTGTVKPKRVPYWAGLFSTQAETLISDPSPEA